MSELARFRVSYAPRVWRQMETALTWWKRNRFAAPTLLIDEIDSALDFVAQSPEAGRRAALRGYRNVRRVLLGETSYHLYYQVDLAGLAVRLVAFRHARRRPPAP